MKKIIILICLVVSVQSVYAQMFLRSDLQSHKWISEDEVSLSFVFTDREMIMQVERRDSSVMKLPIMYYLSDTNDSIFDHSLVGKSQGGLYIKTFEKLIRDEGEIDHVTIYAIKELSSTKLVFVSDKDENVFYDLPVNQIPRKQKNNMRLSDAKKTRVNKQQPLSPKESEEQTQELIRRAYEQIKCNKPK